MKTAQPKPLSRQRLHQLKHNAEGKCAQCQEPLFTKAHCKFHAEQKRKYRVRKTNRPYRTRFTEPLSSGIGGTIRMIRLEKGMKGMDVCRKNGMNSGGLSGIEYDRVSPCLSTLEKIATALGLKTSELLAIHEGRVK